ncbi:LicD family protein [Listeria booriae]|uniref:LicD family protein n=1 Tax=Listeria booriae TaxID=1552123 RepID=UPI001625FF57|nr:LicD family protein [Listeria booriae]
MMLTQIREEQLIILKYFTELCKEYSLTYFLDGGTLAGTQLYKGYLPLDDDIDIAMPRSDYETLITLIVSENSSDFTIDSFRTNPSCHICFAKIKKRGTKYHEVTTNQTTENFIDIFPLDRVIKRHGLIWSVRVWAIQNLKGILFLRQIKKEISRSKKILLYSTSIFSNPLIYKVLTRLMTYQNKKNAAFVANFPGMVRKEECASTCSDYFPPVEKQFCNIRVNIPHNSEQIIRDIYGKGTYQHKQVQHFQTRKEPTTK